MGEGRRGGYGGGYGGYVVGGGGCRGGYMVGGGGGYGGGYGPWAAAVRASRDGKTKMTKSVRHQLPLRVDA